jgi:hypothetical protein
MEEEIFWVGMGSEQGLGFLFIGFFPGLLFEFDAIGGGSGILKFFNKGFSSLLIVPC